MLKGEVAVSLIVVALLGGGAVGYFGAISNPQTTTIAMGTVLTSVTTTTHLVTQNMTIIASGTKSYTVVVFTVIDVQTVVYEAVCTTNSAGSTTTYYQQVMGGPTSVTTEIPSTLPSDFIATVTTAQGYSVVTQVYTTSQC